jgi:hypothetical protein
MQTVILMKTVRNTILFLSFSALVTSCSVFSSNKRGCPTNGKNVGAEKLLDGNSPKAKKFRA